MSSSLVRSALVFLGVTLFVCLLLGLSHMFGRAVTLDNVRAIDFRLLDRVFETLDPGDQADRRAAKRILDALATPGGHAFFPIALLTPDGCLESGRFESLCGRLRTSADFEALVAGGTTTRHYGTQVLRTGPDDFHYFTELGPGAWLVGDAGHYVGSGSPFHQELTFLAEAPHYLTTAQGFRTMWRKSAWTWALCLLVGAVAWVLYAFWIRGAEQRLKQLTAASRALDGELGEKQLDMNRLRAERDAAEERFERLAREKDQEIVSLRQEQTEAIRSLKVEQQVAQELLDEAAQSYQQLVEQQSALQEELKKARKRLGATDIRSDAELAHQQLFELKKLWLTDPDWLERNRIEQEIAATDLGRSPFTDFIAFVRMEHYIKKTCDLKGIERGDDMLEGIDALHRRGFLSAKDRNLLHGARMARNAWFHAGKPPERETMERLLRFLNTRKHPEIRPQV